MVMHHIRHGAGKPLLLIHGLGGSWQSWNTIVDRLAVEREVIANQRSTGTHCPASGRSTRTIFTSARRVGVLAATSPTA